MSGTSLDGITAILTLLPSDAQPEVLGSWSQEFSPELKQRLQKLCHAQQDTVDLLGETSYMLALATADVIHRLLEQTQTKAEDVVAVGSHGQTIRHRPPGQHVAYPFTLQIGDAATIAHQTGITTVADFRSADMAAGGQGAPLAPAFHQAFFCSHEIMRTIVNIGGIGNVTILPGLVAQRRGEHVYGFDTGPGNVLMDAWIGEQQQQPYDDQGNWAAGGKVQPLLLAQLSAHPYFKLPLPKSTGREDFHMQWLQDVIKQQPKISPQDVQRTLLELTATTITQAIREVAPQVDEVYVCGGGACNTFLMTRLAQLLQPASVVSSEVLGVPPQLVEPLGFAWLAQMALAGIVIPLSHTTGATTNTICGAIYSKAPQ